MEKKKNPTKIFIYLSRMREKRKIANCKWVLLYLMYYFNKSTVTYDLNLFVAIKLPTTASYTLLHHLNLDRNSNWTTILVIY